VISGGLKFVISDPPIKYPKPLNYIQPHRVKSNLAPNKGWVRG